MGRAAAIRVALSDQSGEDMPGEGRLAVTGALDDEHRKAISPAVEKCAETVNRAMVSLLAVALFCLLTTFGTPDRSLVAPEASIKIPSADVPISFVGFLIVAPLL